MADVPDRTEDAARELYALSPDEFLDRRAELAKRARADGAADAARAIERLRKPTVAAWIVNVLALDDPSVAQRLTELGDRLRRAQHALDAGKLRELSKERRTLVAELAKEAFKRAKKVQPPAGLRDEVTGTLDAAIADPDVAERLGRLPRAEQWSGFGFAGTGTPELTLVRGGQDEPERPKPAAKPSAAERRRQERTLNHARAAFEAADTAFDEAKAAEQDLGQQVKRLTKKLATLQDELEQARDALEAAHKEVGNARSRRREARSALDRAERA